MGEWNRIDFLQAHPMNQKTGTICICHRARFEFRFVTLEYPYLFSSAEIVLG
jgi:hypothetical protein